MESHKIQNSLCGQRLKGKVALVTGGGRGIGQAIAELFAAHGAKVLVATRTAKHGETTVDKIRSAGGLAELLEVRLGAPDAAKQCVDHAVQLWGVLDIVVHNAAYVPHSTLINTSNSEFQKSIDVSVNTAFWLIKNAYPYLKKSSSGRLLFTSSLSAEKNHLSGLAHYGATKAAINALVRGAAVELGPDKITVNAVSPGGTRSPTFEASLSHEAITKWEDTIPLRRVGDPFDVAKAMLFLASDDAEYITGQNIIVDGGQLLGQSLPLDPNKPFGAP